MQVAEPRAAEALARLRRAHGQLGGLIRVLEEARDTAEVLTLLPAVPHWTVG